MTVPFAVTRAVTLHLSAMFAESPVLRETAARSRLLRMYPTLRVVPESVVSALWMSVGPVGNPRLPLIVDELQLALRGKGYDAPND